jgi:hypothetical protein
VPQTGPLATDDVTGVDHEGGGRMSSVAVEAPIEVGQLWRSVRLPVAIGAVALALVALLAAVTASNSVPLDPRSTSPTGTHALSVLLGARGVSVAVPATVGALTAGAAGGNETVVLAEPAGVSDSVLHALAASKATVVLVDARGRELDAFAVSASVDNLVPAGSLAPQCSLPAAVAAGSVRVDGTVYAVGSGTTGCYRAGSDAAVLSATRAGGGWTVVLGSGTLLTNAQLATEGDAALSLGLLDGSPRLAWVPPGALGGALAAGDRHGLFSLLPSGLDWALVQLLVAVVVLGLWRARRLGRPVVEPLPVVVRAAETVEGNARLLHAARARGTAAGALRAATQRRIATMLRLGHDPDPVTLVALLAEQTGQPTGQVHALLYGAEPPDDPALVRLAAALPALEAAAARESRPVPTTTPDSTTGGQQ